MGLFPEKERSTFISSSKSTVPLVLKLAPSNKKLDGKMVSIWVAFIKSMSVVKSKCLWLTKVVSPLVITESSNFESKWA